MTASGPSDFLVSADHLVTVDANDRILAGHALVVRERRIHAILPVADALRRFPKLPHLALPGHVLMPGLVNAHTHAAMGLFRGLADDLPLMTWLEQHIWPAEQRWVGEDFVHDGSLLAAAEMIRGGTTCFADMYFFPDATARAAGTAHLRCVLHPPVLEFATAWARDAGEYIHKALELRDRLRGHPLITVGIGPHAPYTVGDAALQRIITLTNELSAAVPLQMHVHETAGEVADAIAAGGPRPLARLHALGLTGPGFQCVHMTQVDEQDLALLAATDSHVVHCPSSNMKLASGHCPVARLLAAGVNVALGTDGGASNNTLDMFAELRLAALLGKSVAGDAAAVPARQALRMATINGARALGLDADIGSLEAGKSADFIAVDLAVPESQPLYDVASQLVYACDRRQVTHAWVAGRQLLDDRQLTTLNAPHLQQLAVDWAARIKP